MTAVVGNLLGVAENIVNGDVKTNATEGPETIQSEGVTSNSTDIESAVEGGEPSSRLRNVPRLG